MLSKEELKKRAKNIKLAAFDVDGVMTVGSLIFDENGVEYKKLNSNDGQGIVMLNNSGFKTAIITARQNGTVRVRFNILKMTDLYEGQKNKEEALKLVNEILKATRETIILKDKKPVTVSAGFMTCTEEMTYEVLLQEVDNKLYTAKRSGKNCVIS